jgi:hypothetical protein
MNLGAQRIIKRECDPKGQVAMATSRERFIVDEKGKKTGVVLSMQRYQRLLADLHDLAAVAERRSEKPVPAGELKRRLKEDGKL